MVDIDAAVEMVLAGRRRVPAQESMLVAVSRRRKRERSGRCRRSAPALCSRQRLHAGLLALWCPLRSATQRTTHAGFTPAAISTSAGATKPVGVSKVLSVSATSVHAATRTPSERSLMTAR